MRQGDDRAALARALARYRAAPRGARLLIRGRSLLADLAAVEREVPPSGSVVDLGSGHGLVANLLREASAAREVVGIEPDERKVAIARLTERPGVSFVRGDALVTDLPPCDAVTIVDVLYLMTPEAQERVVARAATALRPGGRLVVYAQERRAADPRFWLGYAQELLATGAGLTRGRAGRLHYSTRGEMVRRIGRAGLAVRVQPLPLRPYTDVIYVGVRH